MERRPRIGITMRLEIGTNRFYLGRDYCEAVEACGGVPVHIGLIPKAAYIAEAVAGLDGVLLPGSNTDTDPAYYGQEPHPKLGTVIPVKDQTDSLVLEEVEKRGLPLLGICFGMQILNVSRGGSLIQDIGSQTDNAVKHDQGMPYDRNSHSIEIDQESLLAGLALSVGNAMTVRVNSSHHQALNRVGENLKATAWTSDGVIECVEDTRPDRYVLGVQWHPELTFGRDNLSQAIFRSFVERCCGQ